MRLTIELNPTIAEWVRSLAITQDTEPEHIVGKVLVSTYSANNMLYRYEGKKNE